ncbi:MAG: PepSY domain-containing protein [Caulobacteraceae bacterium]|nr:PepSY domain-containing protein [Caulobacteraceae bacterium]
MSKPIWPRIPSGFVRAVLAGHSALGLAFAALIYLVCFSGTVAVYANELHRWERPDVPVAGPASATVVQAAAAEALAVHGKAEHLFINLPTPDLPRLTIYVDKEKGEDPRVVAGADGHLIGPQGTAWTDFMARLHIDLHLPQTWGIFIVGLTGVTLLSSLISGLFAHPRVFRDAFHLRWGGSKRLQEADLHNRIGVWGLPFHVMISLTGAFLGLTTIIVGILALAVFKGDVNKAYELFLPPQPIDDPRPAPLPDIKTAFSHLPRMGADGPPTYVGLEHPGERGGAILIVAGPEGRLSRGDNYTFDAAGQPLSEQGIGSETVGAQIIQAVSQLHFGWFGGWAVKLAYAILGAGITIVTSSGVAIWLARRRAKGRPAPRWERIWIAAVWSQPIAYPLSALAALLAGAPPLAVWALATLAALATAAAFETERLSRVLPLTGGLLLVILPLAHALVWRGRVADPMAWFVETAILALGLGLLASVLVTSLAARPRLLAVQPAE